QCAGQDDPPRHQGRGPRRCGAIRLGGGRETRRPPATGTSARHARPCWPPVLPLPRLSGAPELPIGASVTRTERRHRTSPGAARLRVQIGTPALATLDAPIAGYVRSGGPWESVVLCG